MRARDEPKHDVQLLQTSLDPKKRRQYRNSEAPEGPVAPIRCATKSRRSAWPLSFAHHAALAFCLFACCARDTHRYMQLRITGSDSVARPSVAPPPKMDAMEPASRVAFPVRSGTTDWGKVGRMCCEPITTTRCMWFESRKRSPCCPFAFPRSQSAENALRTH